MTDWGWTRENPPRWDRAKQAVFGADGLDATGLQPPALGEVLADEWWRVESADGTAVGYGWLDNEWGDAQVTFVVASERRGEGVGGFILARLEAEAGIQGLNYIYNVVPDSHPDRVWMTGWLIAHGFDEGSGDLRRRVPAATPESPAS